MERRGDLDLFQRDVGGSKYSSGEVHGTACNHLEEGETGIIALSTDEKEALGRFRGTGCSCLLPDLERAQALPLEVISD